MQFGAILAGVTVLTFILIFGSYKLFLNKPPVNVPLASNQTAKNLTSSPSPGASTPSLQVNPSPKPSISKIIKSLKPSSGIIVLENSVSPSPASSGSQVISGTINLVGSAPSGSSLVIASRPTGSGEQFKVVIDGITAQNNASWSWSGAQNGTKYDLFAVLKGKSGSVDIDYASSPASTVKAPYSGQVFVVDAGYAMSTPTGTITVTCTTHTSDNKWLATVNYPIVNGAQMYKLQVGTTSGASDLVDSTKNAQTADVILNANIVYYARYAVASVSYPTAYQYSAFSSPTPISC